MYLGMGWMRVPSMGAMETKPGHNVATQTCRPLLFLGAPPCTLLSSSTLFSLFSTRFDTDKHPSAHPSTCSLHDCPMATCMSLPHDAGGFCGIQTPLRGLVPATLTHHLCHHHSLTWETSCDEPLWAGQAGWLNTFRCRHTTSPVYRPSST